MKAVIYARTAVKPRAHEENKIQTQIATCRQYAKEKGFEVIEVFSDAGYSGAHLDRPALTQMRQLIARDAIVAVVVADPARLTRSARDAAQLEQEFGKWGTRLHCVTSGETRPVKRIHMGGRDRKKQAA